MSGTRRGKKPDPGGALFVFGAMMLTGVFMKSFALASTSIATAVYVA